MTIDYRVEEKIKRFANTRLGFCSAYIRTKEVATDQQTLQDMLARNDFSKPFIVDKTNQAEYLARLKSETALISTDQIWILSDLQNNEDYAAMREIYFTLIRSKSCSIFVLSQEAASVFNRYAILRMHKDFNHTAEVAKEIFALGPEDDEFDLVETDTFEFDDFVGIRGAATDVNASTNTQERYNASRGVGATVSWAWRLVWGSPSSTTSAAVASTASEPQAVEVKKPKNN